ncbi:MAG: NAD(P)/FAD-dependent oxidoreductase [Fusobacterium sp.]|nr:NAD(P)/FAD-dependent oxidoreductase [Fusobacterium sp.]
MKVNLKNIIIPIDKNQDEEIFKNLELNGIRKENIKNLKYLKKSIDSRNRREIKFIYALEIELKEEINLEHYTKLSLAKENTYKKRENILPKKTEIAVVGTGPAGLFSALRLAELGYTPIVFERGEEVEKRNKTTADFIKNSKLNPNSNIQFGEGGAGTYSDGKLNTRIKSEYIEKVFEELVDCGAQQEILWNYKPHIGTDVLRIVVKNLREKIKSLGGKFYFNSLVKDIKVKNNEINSLIVENTQGNKIFNYEIKNVIFAIGHSSRDTYRMLHSRGVAIENKPFAIGVRIEHLRKDIDKMQYGACHTHPLLEAATYNMAFNNKKENRGTFSFCMCPGGEIVNASSEIGASLVNGMSYSTRNGKFSNSAIVVGVSEKDFGEQIFSGMNLQEKLEKKTYEIVGNYGAIYQNVLDFMKDKTTKNKIESSYQMELESYNMNKFFPDYITRNLHIAFENWQKNSGIFINKNVNLIGTETRTSAPVKILRDIKGESISIRGLYPIGEGAGYAGGIMSAAVDGLRVVDLAFSRIIE